MSSEIVEMTPEPRITVQQYLDATAGASDRSRYVTVTMVATSLFVLVAVLNSMQSWMLRRVQAASNSESQYVISKIGQVPTDPIQRDAYTKRYEALYAGLVKSYTDNAFSLRVPVFGFAFDTNDVGLFGGTALVAILGMMIYCLQRELDNLRLSFGTLEGAQLHEFYTLLAMRQVFTIPPTTRTGVRHVASTFPKLLWFAPLAVQILVLCNDYDTKWIYAALQVPARRLLAWEMILAILLVVLTTLVIWRLIEIDKAWRECYERIHQCDT